MKSINPVIIEIYNHFITSFAKEKQPDKNPMNKFFKFLNDFEMCPYLLNQRTCFFIYYYTVLYKNKKDSQDYS